MRARPLNVGNPPTGPKKASSLTSGEYAAKFKELAMREADIAASLLQSLHLGGESRDVVAEKQQSTANGGLETSTFTVAARVRPLSEMEQHSNGGHAFACVAPSGPGKSGKTETASVLTPKLSLRGTPSLDKSTFAFDKFFGATSTDDELYTSLGRPLVHRAIQGQIGVMFAYGQTGSGKTHTMGGLLRRVCGDLYGDENSSGGNQNNKTKRGPVSFSYFEVLGNSCVDCLVEPKGVEKSRWGGTQSAASTGSSNVQIGEGMDGGVITKNLSSHDAPDACSLLALVEKAQSRRTTAATEKNAQSSRSHGVGIITIGAKMVNDDEETDEYGPKPGVLYVIDLAGSERSSDSKNHSKERMDETKAVNLSLMSLKECIRARTAAARPAVPGGPGAPHVPYRRSKLTLLMKDVFDISCQRMCSTVVVACVSPNVNDAAHTLNTLTYAAPLRVAISLKKDSKALPVDPKDPVLWSHDVACDWLHAQIVESGGKYASSFDVEKMIPPGSSGREMCSLPEPEFHRRVRSQMPGQMGASVAKKAYSALWALIVDAKTRRRRPDGTVLSDEDEAREVLEAEQALAARAVLWAERDKAMARGGF
jgi:kinesin family protein 2/24